MILQISNHQEEELKMAGETTKQETGKEFLDRIIKRDSDLTKAMRRYYENNAQTNRLYVHFSEGKNYHTVRLFDGFDTFGGIQPIKKKGKISLGDGSFAYFHYHYKPADVVLTIMLSCVERMQKEGYNVIPAIGNEEILKYKKGKNAQQT